MAEPEIVTPPNLPLRDGDVLDRASIELVGTDKTDGDRTVRIPLSVLGADADRNRRTLKVVSASSYTLEPIDATKVVVLTGFGSVAVTVPDAIMETLNEGEFIIVTGDETTAVVAGSGVNIWTIQGASTTIRNWGVGRLRQIYVGEVGGDFINGLYLYGDIERPDLVDVGSQQDITGSKRFFGTAASTPFRFTRHGTDSTACAIRLVKERGTKESPTDAALADTVGSVQAAVRRQIPSAPASAEHQVGNFRFFFVSETASGVEGRWELVLNKDGAANAVISAFADGSSIIRGTAANVQLDATGSGTVPGLDFTKNDGVDGYRVEYDDTGGLSTYERATFTALTRLTSSEFAIATPTLSVRSAQAQHVLDCGTGPSDYAETLYERDGAPRWSVGHTATAGQFYVYNYTRSAFDLQIDRTTGRSSWHRQPSVVKQVVSLSVSSPGGSAPVDLTAGTVFNIRTTVAAFTVPVSGPSNLAFDFDVYLFNDSASPHSGTYSPTQATTATVSATAGNTTYCKFRWINGRAILLSTVAMTGDCRQS